MHGSHNIKQSGYRRFGRTCCLQLKISLEHACSDQTSAHIYQHYSYQLTGPRKPKKPQQKSSIRYKEYPILSIREVLTA